MSKPLITVITIVYNDLANVEKTIISVLSQTYQKIEYIVIDGESNDGTTEVVNRYKDRIDKIICEKDFGIYDAMNKGIKKASGEWVIFMNSNDTFFSNDIVENIFKIDYTGFDIIYGNIFVKCKLSKIVKPRNLNEFWKGMPFTHQASFVRTATHLKYLFDLKYKVSSVYNLFYKMYTDELKFKYLDLIIANYDLTGLSHYSFYWLWDYWRINLKYSKGKLHLVFFKSFRYFLSRVRTNIKRL